MARAGGGAFRQVRGPVATGLLLAVAFPPLHLVVPSFVALVPLAVHLDRLGGTGGAGPGHAAALSVAPRRGRWAAREAFRAGAVAGAVAWALLLAWIPPALLGWSGLAVPLYGLAVAVLAGLTGCVAVAVRGLRAGVGVPLALALPLAWTAGEWLRAHLPGPLAFPWLELGTSLTGRPEWVGAAEVVGTRGVTFWLAAVAGLLAVAWREGSPPGAGVPGGGAAPRPSRAVLPAAAALALAAAVPVAGVLRAGALETRPVARVAVVQPDATRRTHPEPRAFRDAVWAALDRLAPEVTDAGVDLVVLPEAVLPDTLGTAAGDRAEARLAGLAERIGAPVMAGMLVRSGGREEGDAGARGGGAASERMVGGTHDVVHNSVVLVDGGGRRPWRYDKRHLVPLVERTPIPPLPGLGPGVAGYAPGGEPGPARVGPTLAAGAFVCYESAFSGVSRALVAAGADLLVNVTNDGWFGGPGGRTHALWQHPAHLVMRAVETRTGIARAASTGVSFFVDPVGRIEGRTPFFEEAVSVATVRAAPGPTLFVRLGDVTGAACTAATVALLLAGGLRRDRHIAGAGG